VTKRLKNFEREILMTRKRIVWIVISLLIFLLLLIAQLFHLQVFQASYYSNLSKSNQIRIIPLPPIRGKILDRNGKILADNAISYNLMIIPGLIPHLKNTIHNIKQLIPLSDEETRVFYKHQYNRNPFYPIVLKHNLSMQSQAIIYSHLFEFQGIMISEGYQRTYPYSSYASHVVGYNGLLNHRELSIAEQTNYLANSYIGISGIELQYEKQLHGHTGIQKIIVDAKGRPLQLLEKNQQEDGQDVHLTIDMDLQIAAYKALNNRKGAIVALDPNNGDILALVSNPSFDPNNFNKTKAQQYFKKLNSNPLKPMFNRAIHGQFSPGSSIKPIIALEALKTKIINPETTIFDPGYYSYKNTHHVYHDWLPGGHKEIDLYHAITYSCDTFFYELAPKLGIQRVNDALDKFGFGHLTGVDLPSESTGLVPNDWWKQHKLHEHWYIGDTILTTIGQSYTLVTPIQLAVATALISKKGQSFHPHFLQYTSLDHKKKQIYKPTLLSPIVHNAQYWTLIHKAMHNVILNGTGRRFGSTPYSVAGKTGTTQLIHHIYGIKQNFPDALKNHSFFIAFSPFEKPKIAVAILVENGSGAVQVGRKMLDVFFKLENP
jgi:penicillin-binding protein 2